MGFAMMSPEERAKSSIALQQVRAGGNMSDEMMQTAYKAAATPEEKRDIEAKMMQSHAAEYEKAHGMAAGSAMANEQYTTGTGGTRNVNVNTIHQLEIDMHADTETITHAVINVMTTLRREIQEQANKAINDKVQGAVSRSQITAPK